MSGQTDLNPADEDGMEPLYDSIPVRTRVKMIRVVHWLDSVLNRYRLQEMQGLQAEHGSPEHEFVRDASSALSHTVCLHRSIRRTHPDLGD